MTLPIRVNDSPALDRLPAAFRSLEVPQRRLALALVEELAPAHRRAWVQELAQMPHAAAVALLRSMLEDGEGASPSSAPVSAEAAQLAEIGPLQAFFDRARFFAVLVMLTPAERRLAQALVEELPIAARRAWLRQLAAQSLQDAADRAAAPAAVTGACGAARCLVDVGRDAAERARHWQRSRHISAPRTNRRPPSHRAPSHRAPSRRAPSRLQSA